MFPLDVLAARFVTRVVSGFAEPMPLDAEATSDVAMIFGVGVPERKFPASVALPLMAPASAETLTVCPDGTVMPPPGLKLTFPAAESTVSGVAAVVASAAPKSTLLPAPVACSLTFGVLASIVATPATEIALPAAPLPIVVWLVL